MNILTQHMQKVVSHVRTTDGQFRDLYRNDLSVCPIPFFGDLETARVLTVGVNPACTEFNNRCWPQSDTSIDYLELRLKNYFHLKAPSPHQWFQKWEEALNHIDRSSYRSNAAHLDLSPRATEFMSRVPARRFQSMVALDIGLFFEALCLCPSVNVVLIAGCVTNEFYIDDFIAANAARHDFQFVAHSRRTPGKGKVAYYSLANRRRSLPVFFCSVSPSARNASLLPQRIAENRDKLLSYLNCGCVTNN